MKGCRFVKSLAAGVFLSFFVFSCSFANTQESDYISKNGISLKSIETYEVRGKIILSGLSQSNNIKILAVKDKKKCWFDANIENNRFEQEIWLTEGKGIYTIAIMLQLDDNRYKYGPELKIQNTEEVNKFLVPARDIDSSNKEIITLASEITKDKVTDTDKAKAIYEWVSNNIEYDYVKYENHLRGDFNNKYGSINTLETRTGVCYDYATLTAALGRAVGLQTKVIEGEGKLGGMQGLHAWNEIYITELNKWISIDTTFRATTGENFFNSIDFNKSHEKKTEY